MIAKQKLQAKIGGVSYAVNAGEVVPPAVAAHYAAAGVSSVFESEPVAAATKSTESKKGKE